MNQAGVYKKMFIMYLASFVAWIHCIGIVPLGYIYGTYPGKDTLVMTIAVLPGITATIGGLLAGRLIRSIGKKNMLLISMILMIVGGLGMMFVGDKGIGIALMCAAISGFAGGIIPAANYESLVAIAPDNLRDKVCGWSDALCSLGLAIGMFTSGVLASDGVWTRAYAVYFVIIPVFILELIFYPKDSVAAASENNATGMEEIENTVVKNAKAALPACVIALLIIKVFCGIFYSSFGYFSSDYIINDLQIGTSSLVGTVNTVTQIVNIAASAFVFLWLKFFKGFSSLIAQIVIGIFMLGIVMVGPSIPGIVLCAGLLYVGLMSSHSSFSTIMGLAPEKHMVSKAAGLFMAATFVGESLCAYVVPPVARLIFGTSQAANCMKISGIICVIIGVVSLPFFIRAYKLAYMKQEN